MPEKYDTVDQCLADFLNRSIDRSILDGNNFTRKSQGIYDFCGQQIQLYKTSDQRLVIKAVGGYIELETWLLNKQYANVPPKTREEAMRDVMKTTYGRESRQSY